MACSTTIGIITKSRSVFNTFIEQMKNYFIDNVNLVGYCLDEYPPTPLECDLCIVSYYAIKDLAEKLTNKKVSTGHDKMETDQAELKKSADTTSAHGFTRGADYYGGNEHAKSCNH